MYASKLGIVGCDLLVEMQTRDSVAVVNAFFHNRD